MTGTDLEPGIRCLADIVRVHARLRPDAVALECENESRTFAELYERSSRVAAALAADGVGPDDRIAVLARNSVALFELTFGAALLGAVAVHVNWRLAPPEVLQIVEDAQAEVLVAGPDLTPVVERIEPELRAVRRLVVLGPHERWTPYEAWVGAQEPADPSRVAGPDDVALQLYTSGTTGLPKGAMLTTVNVFSLMSGVNRSWELRATDSVNLALMPMFHIAGLGWSVCGLAFGCRTIVVPDVDPAKILAALRKGVTHAFMVPAVIQLLLATPEVSRSDFATLRKLVYGASPISASVLTRAIETMGCELIQVYGLTETTGAITQLDAGDHDPVGRPDLLRSCGRPYPWVEVRIAQADGSDAAEGEVGEVWVRSVQVMAGYWRNPPATAEAITPAGWFKTGDAGFLDADGYLYLYDRVKDMIVTGGENVYPAEVENALMAHPTVADVAAFGVPDERWGEAVKAVVVAVGDTQPTPDALIAFCRQRIAGFKCPKSIDFARVLPRNPSGKLLKRELRAPYWEGAGRLVG